MNPPQVMTEQSPPADVLLHWAALIAKADALGFVGVDSDEQSGIPRTGFRTIPDRPESPLDPASVTGQDR
ncbi:hypothetical protein [Rhodococcoides fascians]|uniref:hypothetical protein n=1 Tax=Rhodococcoides fascians TaxID=1828 RepID=UPI00056B56FF|nr:MULTISPECIES: hypothetical protein [Rhodococcus]OZF15416.1 hypothetical protein CH299_11400 [Rhodococcus sp. 14-2686-1-2]